MTGSGLPPRYPVPLRDAGAEPEPVRLPSAAEAAALRLIGRLRRGRRLAYLDSHFPWRLSGFRYFDALALHELRPDTVFFSEYELTDPFPAPVHRLADFPRLAPRLGVTDAYAVFLSFLGNILGISRTSYGPWAGFRPGCDISQALVRGRIRLHAGIHAGGGFLPRPDLVELAEAVAARSATVFSGVPALRDLPNRVSVPSAYTNTDLYAPSGDRWGATSPLQVVFAADDRPRKGLATVLAAFRELDERFLLHVVGPHFEHVPPGMPGVKLHGWLDPQQLADLYRRCHVIVSPVEPEDPADSHGDGGVTDGFPTATVCDAMSTGALAVSSNPERVYDLFLPGVHYLEVHPSSPEAIRQALEQILSDLEAGRAIADSGSLVVRGRLGMRIGAAARLAAMGLRPSA